MSRIVNKVVDRTDETRDRILNAISIIVDPIKSTISPKGSNVILVGEKGGIKLTNDGVTIAKHINVEDFFDNTVIDLVRHASLKTNSEVGDGTSTTALLIQAIVRGGFKMLDEGWNKRMLQLLILESTKKIVARLEKMKIVVKNNGDLLHIAKVSANGDIEIAEKVVDAVTKAGDHGLIFIEPSSKEETEVVAETGFIMKSGLFSNELRRNGKFSVRYDDVPLLITDKRLYYTEEAMTIMNAVNQAGYEKVAVVAKDFLGEALATFVSNHAEGNIDIVLVKDSSTDSETLEDLASFVGGTVISDKKGRIVDKLTIEDFSIVDSIFSDGSKSIIQSTKGKKPLKTRVSEIKSLLAEDKENEELKSRLASLTSGIVTIKVSGTTALETNEKIYRFEDAVNATRQAKLYGFLVGGGVALRNAFVKEDHHPEIAPLMKQVCMANTYQILENCGEHVTSLVSEIEKLDKDKQTGYNASNGKIENLFTAGVYDPYRVTSIALQNAASIGSAIIGSSFFITPYVNKEESKN